MLRVYNWFCIEGLLLEVLQQLYVVPGIATGLATVKASKASYCTIVTASFPSHLLLSPPLSPVCHLSVFFSPSIPFLSFPPLLIPFSLFPFFLPLPFSFPLLSPPLLPFPFLFLSSPAPSPLPSLLFSLPHFFPLFGSHPAMLMSVPGLLLRVTPLGAQERPSMVPVQEPWDSDKAVLQPIAHYIRL